MLLSSLLKLFCKAQRFFLKDFKPLMLKHCFLASFQKVTFRITKVKEKMSIQVLCGSFLYINNSTATFCLKPPSVLKSSTKGIPRGLPCPRQCSILTMTINTISVSLSSQQDIVSTTYVNEILINYIFMSNVFFSPKP